MSSHVLFALVLCSVVLSSIALAVSLYNLVCFKAKEQSTHQIQYVDPSKWEAEDKVLNEQLEELEDEIIKGLDRPEEGYRL